MKAELEQPNAIFSTDRIFRYTLYREIARGPRWETDRTVNFIGLNPSTADEVQDDPTIRRCIGFARSWGFTRLVMTNIFAFRATYPKDLFNAIDAVGPENDRYLLTQAYDADLVIAAWSGMDLNRDRQVRFLLNGIQLFCLGTTKLGAPRHPLYIRASQQPARLP